GQWEDDNTRALLWRLLLGVIPRAAPPSEWAREMSKKRDEYRSLKAEHRVDISKVVDTTDPMSANPLFSGSASGDDPWSHFYERKEMTDTIKADLERLFPTGCGDHFLAPARQELLLSVLSLWADLHPATGYRQGMHELYGMKWARLMCGREFRVEAVMLLWDHIFASSWLDGRPGLPECIESVAVAMVVSIRDQLLTEDNTGCLQLLMRYPPDQSVSTVISLSLSLAQPGGKNPASATTAPGTAPRTAPGTVPGTAPRTAPGAAPGTGPDGSGVGGGGGGGRGRDGGGGGGGGVAGVLESTGGGAGWEGSGDGGREVKNNWQQGLDEFTRRALNAAHGVAKLAVQTVERSQAAGGGGGGGGGWGGEGDVRLQAQGDGLSGSEAAGLARRLRAACTAMEVRLILR
ncbi:unnamed protein product, partial [Laminaria digitata]